MDEKELKTCIPYVHMAKISKLLAAPVTNFKNIFKGNFNICGLVHSGSDPFNWKYEPMSTSSSYLVLNVPFQIQLQPCVVNANSNHRVYGNSS